MEEKFDEKLLIRTQGIREWRDENLYNRCESTPYEALETLFKQYKIEEDDELVDFGGGRGRVVFYIHNKFNIPVTAIELNETTLDEALDNKRRYRTRAGDLKSPIKFEYGYAENYEIGPEENKFYFFNPFKPVIFEKVVDNIVRSVEENKRQVDIILYYPMDGYKKYLEENTEFVLINKVKLKDVNDKKEKFLIYRWDPHVDKKEEKSNPQLDKDFPLKLKSIRKR